MIKKDSIQKRAISCLILFALLLAQISISKHSIEHPDHVLSIASSDTLSDHDQKHHDKNHKKHKCPECLLTKSLHNALAVDGSIDFNIILYLQGYSLPKNGTVKSFVTPNYQPRAPPAILI